jgi:hypothetical protein
MPDLEKRGTVDASQVEVHMRHYIVPRPLRPITSILLLFVGLVVAAAPRLLTAQTYWRVPGALGGALTGAGVGWAIDIARWGISNEPYGPRLTVAPVGIGVGGLLGFMDGLRADRKLARGDTLTRVARYRLRAATFLAPVAVGSAIAFTVINPSETDCVPYTGPDPYLTCEYQNPRQKAMSDERVALLGIGGGVVVGILAQHRFAKALSPRTRVGIAPNGRGVKVTVPIGW